MWDDPTFRVAVYASLTAVSTALVGAVGYVSKKAVSGCTYYVGKLWDLAERLANKHISFVDSMSAEQQNQTKMLTAIGEDTRAIGKAMAKMGSDPLRTLEVVKEQMIADLMEQMATMGKECRYEEADMVVTEKIRRKKKRTPNDERTSGE